MHVVHEQIASPRAPSAADGGHRPVGLEERRVVDAVAGALAEHRDDPALGDLLVGGAGAQRRTQVGLLAGEQAVADLAVGGEADPVAVAAERPGDRGDDADGGRSAVDVEELGGGAAPRLAVRGEGELGGERAKISSAVTISARLQPCWASSGICSMKRSS